MRVLLDEQLPVSLALELDGHDVDTVTGRGWAGLNNGDLLRQMAGEYDVFLTMDRGIQFQQDTLSLPFGIVLIRAASNRMADLRPLVPGVLEAIAEARPGGIQLVLSASN